MYIRDTIQNIIQEIQNINLKTGIFLGFLFLVALFIWLCQEPLTNYMDEAMFPRPQRNLKQTHMQKEKELFNKSNRK